MRPNRLCDKRLLTACALLAVVGVGLWASWSRIFSPDASGESSSGAARTFAAYADAIRANDAARTYDLLDPATRGSMSLDAWRKFNLPPSGALSVIGVDVGNVRLSSPAEAYGEAVIHLSGGHRLPVTMRLVKQQGSWRVDVGPLPQGQGSMGDSDSGGWHTMRPMWTLIALGIIFAGFGCGGSASASKPHRTMVHIVPSTGGSAQIKGIASLSVPAGALSSAADLVLSSSPQGSISGELVGARSLGPRIDVSIGGATALRPLSLAITLPRDASGVQSADLFVASRNSASGWTPVRSSLGQSGKTITTTVNSDASLEVFTWDWQVWNAGLAKGLVPRITQLLQAVAPPPSDCTTKTAHVTVEPAPTPVVIAGCVNADDRKSPTLRILNAKSFSIGIAPPGTSGYPNAQVLDPGAATTFLANTANPSPFRVEAQLPAEAFARVLAQLVLDALPHGDASSIPLVTFLGNAFGQEPLVAAAEQAFAQGDQQGLAGQILQLLKDKSFAANTASAIAEYRQQHSDLLVIGWSDAGLASALSAAAATDAPAVTSHYLIGAFVTAHTAATFDWSPPCVVDDESFCAFVRQIDGALHAQNPDLILNASRFSPYTCEPIDVSGAPIEGAVNACIGLPAGTTLDCSGVGALGTGGAVCVPKSAYRKEIASWTSAYAVVVPASKVMSNMGMASVGPTQNLIVVHGALLPTGGREEWALVVGAEGNAWTIAHAYSFFDGYLDASKFTPWP